MKLNPLESITRMDINWRAARLIAIGYLALSAFHFVFAIPIGYVSVGVLWFLTFLSGPAGFLFALVTTPASWAMEIVAWYFGATCLLAPFLTLSCHRKVRVSTPSCVVSALLWLATGFLAVCYVFAFAA
jgi:hypothetical protein